MKRTSTTSWNPMFCTLACHILLDTLLPGTEPEYVCQTALFFLGCSLWFQNVLAMEIVFKYFTVLHGKMCYCAHPCLCFWRHVLYIPYTNFLTNTNSILDIMGPDECCYRYYTKLIPIKKIKSYRTTNPNCPKKGVMWVFLILLTALPTSYLLNFVDFVQIYLPSHPSWWFF